MESPAGFASVIDIDQTFLPIGRMRQVSRVVELDDATIVGEMDLGRDHWVYPEHFPTDPIYPGVLLIEAAGQLVALWAWGNGQRGRPRLVRTSAEFQAPVGPSTPRLTLRGEVRRKRHLHFATVTIHSLDTQVAQVEAVLAVLAAS